MSWSNNRIFPLAAVAVMASVMAGCAGDGGGVPIDSGTASIPVSGGVLQSRAVTNEAVSPQAFPQTVSVTRESDGQTVQAVLPAGMGVAAGQQTVVFARGVPVLSGLKATGPGDPGTVVVYSGSTAMATGVDIDETGALTDEITVPNGDYSVSVSGPLSVSGAGQRLDFLTLILQARVVGGVASLPRSVSGELPVNGGSSFPLAINANFPNEFAGDRATLQVTHENGLLRQSKTLAGDGSVRFHDFVFGDNSMIPRSGVQTVELIVE